jgi:hypothetical protein
MPNVTANSSIFRIAVPTLLLGTALVVGACAPKSQIDGLMQAGATPTNQNVPAVYVETFPGESEGCGVTQRDTRAWNTHPVRAINASFSSKSDDGSMDYFSVDIPAGQIMTVQSCGGGNTDLVGAQFADQS